MYIFKTAISTAALIFFANCIALNFGNLDSGYTSEVINNKKTIMPLGLVVHYEYSMNGKRMEKREKIELENLQKLTSNVYLDSGLFSKVELGTKGEYNISVHIKEDAYVNKGFAMLTGISFFLLPSWGTSDITVSTLISDRNGKALGEINAHASSVVIMQLFLILPMPLLFPPNKYDDYITDASRYSINEAVRKGIITSDK